MIRTNWIKIAIVVVTLLLVVISFSNYFHKEAVETIQQADTEISESSKFVFVLKKGISFFTSSSVPLIKGYADISLTDLGKVSNYLTTAQILLKIQTFILKISNLLLFKVLPLIFCIGLFFNKTKILALKLVIVSLFLCPGLSIYTNIIHQISKSINGISIGSNLHEQLEKTKNNFKTKETKLKTHQEEVKQRQLAKARARGKDHISFFKKAEDAVVGAVEKATVKVVEDVKLIEEVLLINTESLFLNLIKFISSILLLVVLLPLLYFYGINILVKNLFQFNLEPYLEQLIKKEE